MLESLLFLLINHADMHYIAVNPFAVRIGPYLPDMFMLFIAGRYIEKSLPRISLILQGFWLLGIVIAMIFLYCGSAQYTPFADVDAVLNKLDHLLGFSSFAVMSYANAHPSLKAFLTTCYNSMLLLELGTIVVLVLFYEKRRLNVFLTCTLIAFIIGVNIYYFFPSTGPAMVVHGIHFSAVQNSVITRFHELHDYQKLTVGGDGGLIAFPSFHVIWAVMVLYAFYNRKWIFYPLLVWNALVIFATMLLGWHFLVDVLGGFVVVAISLLVANALCAPVSTKTLPLSYALVMEKIKTYVARLKRLRLHHDLT